MNALSKEARKELLDHLTRACVLWTEDIMKGYFEDPKSTTSQQLILEAFAGAVTEIASRLPNRTAALQTFLLELQDHAANLTPKEKP